jgi:hypothetical protein
MLQSTPETRAIVKADTKLSFLAVFFLPLMVLLANDPLVAAERGTIVRDLSLARRQFSQASPG